MNENISKLFGIIIALIFFSTSILIMTNIDKNLKNIIKARKNKNYCASELSLNYSGTNNSKEHYETKKGMLIANLLLEKSRSEAEDIIVKSFGETVNLNVKNTNEYKVILNKNIEIKASSLKSFLHKNNNVDVNFIFNNLKLYKIELTK